VNISDFYERFGRKWGLQDKQKLNNIKLYQFQNFRNPRQRVDVNGSFDVGLNPSLTNINKSHNLLKNESLYSARPRNPFLDN
jgi:hypothetical protein